MSDEFVYGAIVNGIKQFYSLWAMKKKESAYKSYVIGLVYGYIFAKLNNIVGLGEAILGEATIEKNRMPDKYAYFFGFKNSPGKYDDNDLIDMSHYLLVVGYNMKGILDEIRFLWTKKKLLNRIRKLLEEGRDENIIVRVIPILKVLGMIKEYNEFCVELRKRTEKIDNIGKYILTGEKAYVTKGDYKLNPFTWLR